jgi:hypothetical protein
MATAAVTGLQDIDLDTLPVILDENAPDHSSVRDLRWALANRAGFCLGIAPSALGD